MNKKNTILFFLILLPFLCNAQTDFYEKSWQKMDSLQKLGLPKSMYLLAENIYQQAKKEKNTPQQVKSIFYKVIFQEKYFDKKTILYAFLNLEKELKNAIPEIKPLLYAMGAEMLTSYYQDRRWDLNKDTLKNKLEYEKPETWTNQFFVDNFIKYSKLSLENSGFTQKIDISEYQNILELEKTEPKRIYVQHKTPTLYDFLANQAIKNLDFFRLNEDGDADYENDISTDIILLVDNDKFLNLNLQKGKFISAKYEILKIFQNVTKFHLNDTDKTTLFELQYRRILWVKQRFGFGEIDEKMLENIWINFSKQTENYPIWAEIQYQYANLLYEQGKKYNPFSNPNPKMKIKEAKDICENVIKKMGLKSPKIDSLNAFFEKNIGVGQCKALLENQILEKISKIKMPVFVAPLQNIPIQIKYQNVKKLHLKLFETTEKQIMDYSDKADDFKDSFVTKKPFKTYNFNLPDDEDYQQNIVQEKINGLPTGMYAVVISDTTLLNKEEENYSFFLLKVTSISLLVRNLKNGDVHIWATDRHTGKPLTNVKVAIHARYYSEKLKHYDEKIINTLYTNKNGETVQKEESNRNFLKNYDFKIFFVAKNGNDIFNTDEEVYRNFNTKDGRNYQIENLSPDKEDIEKSYIYGSIFLDRKIYRPSQTVHFKGIVIENKGNQNRILPKKLIFVVLKDANYQQIASQILETNEFGSISGSFVLPNNTNTGKFSIALKEKKVITEEFSIDYTLQELAKRYELSVNELLKENPELKENNTLKKGQKIKFIDNSYANNYAQTSFSLEEYKRYKFEVKFEPIKGIFRLGDSISVKGKAIGFNEINVTNATTKFTIQRRVNYKTNLIHFGNVTTDTNGEFEIKFKAIPYEKLDKKYLPIHEFEIKAIVTDINGETHEDETKIFVANIALNIDFLPTPNDVNNWVWLKHEKHNPKMIIQNLNGNPENAKMNIKVEKLLIENSYKFSLISPYSYEWERPTKFNYTKEQWTKEFPDYLYDNYQDFHNAKPEKLWFEKTFDTSEGTDISEKYFENMEQGIYRITCTVKDIFGKELELEKYITVLDLQNNENVFSYFFTTHFIKKDGYAGEKAQVLVMTHKENLYVKYEVWANERLVKTEILKLSNEKKMIEIPLLEQDDEYEVSFQVVYRNQMEYSYPTKIKILKPKNELDISFETFRDKLEPNQKEQWRLRIKNKAGEKMLAEMVATLYDASLDKLTYQKHSFPFALSKFDFDNSNWKGNYFVIGEQEMGWSLSNYIYTIFPIKSHLDWGKWYYSIYNSLGRVDYREFEEGELENGVIINEYKIIEKRSSVGAIAGVKGSVIENMPMQSFDRAMQGNIKVRVRGMTSISKEAYPDDLDKSVNTVNTGIARYSTDYGFLREKFNVDLSGVKARTNFSETAFFLPHLTTDENGDILVNFTIPEALTRWRMLGFAHTKDLKFALTEKSLVTQKTLMVTPNMPRFLRETDKITLSSKITSLHDKVLKGQAQLFLKDALTGKNIDVVLKNIQSQKDFELPAGQSISLNWEIEIPVGTQAVTYTVVAKADNFSDGEESTLPVLTNRMLVTETLPLPIRSNQTKNFTFEKLVNNKSTTLTHHNLSVEFTSNPAWYAVQALPYMMEYPYECAEQLFSRYYANSIATHIANSTPKIKQVFEKWKNLTPEAFLSNLDKNQELKNILIEETPWLRNANNEQERKRQLGVLLDLNRMANEMQSALEKLQKKQVSSGAWVWFEGMPEDRYITQHIVSGMGHLDKLKVKNIREDAGTWQMLEKAVKYLDRKIVEDYEELLRNVKKYNLKLSDQHIGYFQLQYLYMRSYFINDWKIEKGTETAFSYYKGQSQKYWLSFSLSGQAMIGLALHRLSDNTTPAQIIKSLKEKAIYKEEMGMYWKQNGGYYWYEAPIETQALMIEFFAEVPKDMKVVDDLKTWLIKQKQTTDWKTTRATAEACYGLLLQGENWLSSDKLVQVSIGNQNITPAQDSPQVEAGTGYYKVNVPKEKITSEMGNIVVKKEDVGVSWGAMYWQYFENLDKITPSETPLKIKKQLFIEKPSDRGNILTEITSNNELKVGDLVKVRIEIRVDRNMEYVHLKDMRASGFEPTNVISQTKYQDGLYYYESTRDVATNFFIGYLPKGSYVFQYDLRVAQAGEFSNGITTIQCLYAPEFSSHSEGIKVKILR